MKEFILEYQSELMASAITLAIMLILRLIAVKTVKRVGRLSDFNHIRTRLVSKYISIALTTLAASALIFIWGVNIRQLGLVFSSVFAVIGVALFAQWSILSNITAGVILFFSFPFKIGDRIKILDKDMDYEGDYIIEDIKPYHLHLRKDNGELMTYPNNLMLQKAVSIVGTPKPSLSRESNNPVAK